MLIETFKSEWCSGNSSVSRSELSSFTASFNFSKLSETLLEDIHSWTFLWVLDRLNTGFVGSNSILGLYINVYACFCVVSLQALGRLARLSKDRLKINTESKKA